MKTSNRILLSMLAIILTIVLTGMITVKKNLVQKGFGEGKTEVFGSKNYKTLRPEIGEFKSLDIAGNFDVTLIPGAQFLEIEGEDNIINKLNIQVYPNGQLEIKAQEGYVLRPSEQINLKIGVDSLSSVHLMDQVNLTAAKPLNLDKIDFKVFNESSVELVINANKLDMQIQNSSSIQLGGKVQKSYITTFNSAKLKGTELNIQDANLKAHNSSSIHIGNTEALSVEAFNKSHIHYSGNPTKIQERAHNSARIKRIN